MRQCGDIAASRAFFERGEVTHFDARAVLEQRTEALAETLVAHDGKRAVREAVEGFVDRDESAAPGRCAGEFDRAFERFRAGVAEEDCVEMRRRFFQQRLGEQPAEDRAIHLHHVWQIHVEHVADGVLHGGMVAADVEDAVAAEEVEVVVAVAVEEVGALRASVDLIESNDPLHFDQRRIQVPLVQRVVFAEA